MLQRFLFLPLLSVRLVALLTALLGVVNVLSALSPALVERLTIIEQFAPLEVRDGSYLAAVLAGFALLVLATNLWRRKYVAWLLTLIVLAVSAIAHLLKGLDYEEALFAAGLAIWLATLAPHFHARSDRPSIQRGLWLLTGALAFTLAYGVAGFFLLDRHFSVHFGLRAALKQTVIMFTQFYDPGLQPITGFGRYFAGSIYTVGATTFGYAFLMLVQPVLIRQPASAAEQRRAQLIVENYGRSSLARMALFADKSYFFSAGGSLIAYVARGRVALVLGDPIGPLADLAHVLSEFQSFCTRNDWLCAFYQTLPDHLAVYKSAGLDALCIGQEAIVDLADFTLEGKAGKEFRTAVNKLTRLGYQSAVYLPPLERALLEELRSVSDEWLTMMHGSEKRFSMGWFAEEYVRTTPVVAVRSAEGSICAFANILPEYQRNECVIDLMRRRPELENGTMEVLFVALFQWAKTQGYASFNLGLSALSGVGEQATDPAMERGLHYIFEHVNQFYNFKGLHSFKEKFHPRWAPRYLVYPSAASLPALGVALVRASSGEDSLLEYFRR